MSAAVSELLVRNTTIPVLHSLQNDGIYVLVISLWTVPLQSIQWKVLVLSASTQKKEGCNFKNLSTT